MYFLFLFTSCSPCQLFHIWLSPQQQVCKLVRMANFGEVITCSSSSLHFPLSKSFYFHAFSSSILSVQFVFGVLLQETSTKRYSANEFSHFILTLHLHNKKLPFESCPWPFPALDLPGHPKVSRLTGQSLSGSSRVTLWGWCVYGSLWRCAVTHVLLKQHPSHPAWLTSLWLSYCVCVCVCVWGALRPLPLSVWPLLTTSKDVFPLLVK